ncbi:hypothetical protein AAY473_029163, partial [Plecturocebus cupreus]
MSRPNPLRRSGRVADNLTFCQSGSTCTEACLLFMFAYGTCVICYAILCLRTDANGHFGRPRQVDHLRSGVPDQPGQQAGSPSLPKIQKISQRPRLVDHLRSGAQDQPGHHVEAPSLLKIQKLAEHDGTC